MSEERLVLEPPDKPLDSDCCGNGCVLCIFDIYNKELEIWKAECELLSKNIANKSHIVAEDINCKTTALHPDKYTEFPIVSVSQETPDILRFRFSVPAQKAIGLSIGQHVIARFKLKNQSTVARQYTPVSPLKTKGYFDLLIKIYTEGRTSQCVKSWQVGDKIEFRASTRSLNYSRNKFDRLLMLCAGTGVAPMCQVISSILEDENDETHLKLLYASKSYKYLMAKNEIDEWSRYWNFSSIFALSQEPEVVNYSYKHGEKIHKGRINKDFVTTHAGGDNSKLLVLVCGPPSFSRDMLKYVKDLGIPESSIHKF
ncbi:NADH-cytochrome b5 reductase-like [Physella acuta]|uniref:NADH-cytochrome b5 reductase-like n=1 Tax=Physella acuta TaxID=109671 RepID=UPI0027DE4342|nr:NADH-cytochrome b5 reductase-like [Physella acuta]XP_059144366.1 NADH-cytochrome b5 reductase-like [Physella acuta]XP_059144367.1 NADH-cytochrome b5 reductase-like [Physella acuta]